jgi:hypothetical protein
MDITLLVGLLGAGATLLAPILTLFCQRYLESLQYKKQDLRRRSALLGNWEGETLQEMLPDNSLKRIKLRVHIILSGREVKGKSIIQWEGRSLKVDLSGGFIYEDIIKLDYKSVDPSIKNFGTALLVLSANGKTLNGRVLGFGSEEEAIVFGKTQLIKID